MRKKNEFWSHASSLSTSRRPPLLAADVRGGVGVTSDVSGRVAGHRGGAPVPGLPADVAPTGPR